MCSYEPNLVQLLMESECSCWVVLFQWWQKDTATVISTLLLVSGITTILHSYFGTRLPLVQGSSFVYLAPALIIMNAQEYRNLTEHVSSENWIWSSLLEKSLVFWFVLKNLDNCSHKIWKSWIEGCYGMEGSCIEVWNLVLKMLLFWPT